MVTSNPLLIAQVTGDGDFLRLKEMACCDEGWSLAHEKKDIKVWSRPVPDSSTKMIKVWTIFSGISSTDLFNTLMDPLYRKEWDTHLILFYEIGHLNFNNEITYYAVSFPPPLRSRDFVLQTSWLSKHTEHFILNHSVCHKDHPPRPGFIRAVSYFTGYFIKGVPDDGCEMFFVSQTDLQGFIPNWVTTKCTQILAPRIVKQIEQAATGYGSWKSQNKPDFYPWLNPNQLKATIISVDDCVPSEEERQSAFFRNVVLKHSKQESDPQNTNLALKSDNSTATAGTSEKVTEVKDRRKNSYRNQSSTNTTGKKEKHKKRKKDDHD